MRLGHVRIATAGLLGGGVLALGALGTAQAAQLKPPVAAATATQCQALPAAAAASPSPSPFRTIERLPTRSRAGSPRPSESDSPTATGSASGGTGQQGQASPSGQPLSAGSAAQPFSRTSRSAPADDATASLDVYIASSSSPASPGPSPRRSSLSVDPTPSATSSAGATGQPGLCVSLRRSQASITPGHAADYVVQVSAENAPASEVSVTLIAEPASQKPVFTRGCAAGDGTALCAISSVSVKQPVVLHAQIAVASGATSVTSVKLTVIVSIATTQGWNPPTVAGSTAVSAASSARRSLAGTPPLLALPLGPIPDLNGVASTLIEAGNAAGLFPVITPSPAPSPTSAAPPSPAAARRGTRPTGDFGALSRAAPGIQARVAGLIALALAVMLTIMRLSVRRRSSSRKAPG